MKNEESYKTYQNEQNPVRGLYGFADQLVKKRWFFPVVLSMLFNWVLCGFAAIWFPASGDAFQYWNTFILMALDCAAIVSIVLMAIAVTVNLSGLLIGRGIAMGVKEYKKNLPSSEQMALPVGEYANPIHPDILLVQRPGETVTDYLQRIEDAKSDLKPDVWLVCLKRSFDRIVVESSRPDECRTIPRTMFDDPAQPMDYAKESKSDFEDYLSYFAAAFQGYSISTKFGEKTDSGPVVKSSERPILKFMGYVRACANVVLLLLCALSLSAQSKKDIVVRDMAGMSTGTVDSGNIVYFHFNGGTVQKNVRTKTNFAELINDGRPHNYSQLQRVDVGRTAVWVNNKQTIESNGTAQKPAALFADATGSAQPVGKSFAESLPDSATVATGLNNVKHQLPFYKSRAYQYISPVIEFCTFLFFFLSPLFGIGLGFSRLIADSAKENGNLGEDVRAQNVRFSRFSWYLSIILVGCIYLCATFSMFFWEFHPIGIAVAVYLLQYPAKWGVNFLTSNGQFRKDQKQKQKGGGYGQPQIDR